ncbi:MAG: NUDIX domain-containing protein [Devosia sp.]|uniref:NUDIX hydrolase n=1 Tax=Devosia sp. TaxID=1871048 RepID=UPI001AC16ADF|nr:NUDIX domain-containing protein [Devosia sp.]MBN9315810.1 NUDIX domain-containing protein [Devosia sp.]
MPDSRRPPNAASVALIDRDRVLLIQRARKPYFGMWSLPGGRLEPGETAEQAAEREILEEVGLRVWRLHPIRRMLMGEGNFVLQVFATEAFEGEILVAADEITAYRWVRLDEIGLMPTTPDLGEVVAGAFRVFDRS